MNVKFHEFTGFCNVPYDRHPSEKYNKIRITYDWKQPQLIRIVRVSLRIYFKTQRKNTIQK